MNQQAAATLKAAGKIPGYAWVVLFAVYMATMAAPLNQMKVPPVLTVLMDAFQMDYGRAGDLMSIFSILGFVLALPAGFILLKIGIKKTGLIAVGALLIGTVLGALADTIFMLFAGRFIEGAGMGLLMVAAPAAISVWFPAAKRAMPMGLWASCVGVGSIAALNFAPVLEKAHGWQAVWWAGAIFAGVAFVLFAILFRMPKRDEINEPIEDNRAKKADAPLPSLSKAMANPSLWMIAFAFGCFNLTVMAWSTFYPNFLEVVRGYTAAQAGFLTSLIMAVAIFSAPAGGYISDRIGSRKKMIIIPFVALGLMFLFPFHLTGWGIPVLMLITGLLVGPIAPVCLAAVPEIMKAPQLIGIGMGVAALCQNLGMFIGPMIFGRLVESTGWAMSGYLLIPLCAFAIIAAWKAKIR
ncbi:MAG TPA: MFS transporter [Acidobacteriota bacterium]|nr:MFS transporter [Acidobacteriota bacterium]